MKVTRDSQPFFSDLGSLGVAHKSNLQLWKAKQFQSFSTCGHASCFMKYSKSDICAVGGNRA